MRIYHTETQADYDALMVELDEQGCKWSTGDKMTKLTENWKRNSSETCVRVDKKVVMYDEKSYYAWKYPEVPIQKYKSKAGEKMRFTKENVYKMVERYRSDFDYLIGDLKSDIFNLDDTPKKVAVPKFVADVFSSELHFEYEIQESRDIPHVLSAAFSEVSSKKNIKFLQWVKQYPDKYVMAVKYGYTIEPEKLYYIPLPHLETSDGIQQVLSKRDTYFASRPNEKLKQRYTKAELERVPEVYKPFAKPIEEESEYEF